MYSTNRPLEISLKTHPNEESLSLSGNINSLIELKPCSRKSCIASKRIFSTDPNLRYRASSFKAILNIASDVAANSAL